MEFKQNASIFAYGPLSVISIAVRYHSADSLGALMVSALRPYLKASLACGKVSGIRLMNGGRECLKCACEI